MYRTSQHRIRKAGTALAIGLATALVAVAAQADAVAAPQVHASVVVRYDDLNLGTTAGAQALYARITSAAQRACGNAPATREIRQQQNYRTCVDAAVDRSVKKIDSERLQALHAQRSASSTVG